MICAVLSLAASICIAAPPAHDFSSFVRDLIDLDKLPLLEDGVTCREWTSFDRNEYKSPGSNGDCGQYIRVEPNGEAVMAEMNGPGCIVRIWSANPAGTLRIYLDGAAAPAFEQDFPSLVQAKVPGLPEPIVGVHATGGNCFLPITYRKHCRVVVAKPGAMYYNVDY
jgi:hypothetical protein